MNNIVGGDLRVTEWTAAAAQIILEEGLEGCQLGVHHEDAGGDASLAQLFALVGYGYG